MLSRRLLFAFCLLVTPALADDPAPWQAATAVMKAADADAAKSGVPGIAAHLAELEKAMADGAANFPPKPGADGKRIVLTDGPTETLAALMAAANAKQATTALPSPYPEIGLMLAIYYSQMHRPQDALQIIETTFRLKPVPDAFLGLHDAGLLTEKATAYQALKRWDEGLATADQALKASMNDRDKARSNRSRGFFLTELGRLDDAVGAYQDSQKLEPDNVVARNELAYIARLKAGVRSEPPVQFIPGQAAKPAQ
jgi:tetratricopeptide (TPR) repeat protein